MYETFFRFRQRPFLAAPDLSRYFPGQAIEHARQSLARCIERQQGPGLLVGPTGTGKSLVCQLLADQLSGSFRVTLLANTRLGTRKSLLQNILFELGLPFRGLDEGEMRLSLIEHVTPSEVCPNGMLLIVDEAQSLPLRLLDELRALTNIVKQGRSRVQLVLAGGPALEERFTHPKLESFNQRIAARCYLSAFQRGETSGYVRAQIAWVDGTSNTLFPDETLEAVFRATDGVPRLINQVCDLALTMAAENRRAIIEPRDIEQAWAELQQLPAPWHNPSPSLDTSPAMGIVEFGALDDDDLSSDDALEPAMAGDATERRPAVVSSPDSPTVPPQAHTERADSTRISGEPVATAVEADHGGTSGDASLVARLFGEDFDEQEVVHDRFLPVTMSSIAARLPITQTAGKNLECPPGLEQTEPVPLARLADQETPPPVEAADAATHVPGGEEGLDVAANAEEALLHAIRSLPGVDDPRRWEPGRLNDLETIVTTELPVAAHRPHLLAAPPDDRDLLVVEDDGCAAVPAPAEQGRAHRQEYRHLFSRLRRG